VSRALLASLLVLLTACGARKPQEGPEDPPQVVLHGARLQSYEGEELAMTGQASTVTYQRFGGDLMATDVVLRLPAKAGGGEQPARRQSGETEIRAPRMDVNMQARQLVGSGGVEVRTPDGAVGQAPRGTYDAGEQRVRGLDGVTLRGPDYSVRADSFQLSLEDGTFSFEGSVKTVLGATQ
jgi:lipopolysaccharide export system protein LptC